MDFNDSEKELLGLLKSDSTAAFDAIFQRHKQKVYLMALATLHDSNDAQDIVQDVFLMLWNKRRDLDISASLKSYLITAAKNKSLDLIKRRGHHKKYTDQIAHQSEAYAPVSRFDAEETKRKVNLALSQVTSNTGREAISLYYLEELSHQQTGQQLGISGLSSKSYVFKAIRQIRKYFQEKEGNR
ncbi:RNA polymerase sigma factor [Chitinophaga rhizophila]|uniref:Sigma-70 family RNA polymerase sigma factor n=1 Tax=Chitinophaga rhizophila TaxID=2866212 RepID=A0ABS7G761_9BACT|nr:sigma-70 family RNA polymerase sigma factor [Chitinophaga rhizophila]MBW8683486.1 sigma-70 family RNA polymerase sigma factor [Chitinophaga rhizophila]